MSTCSGFREGVWQVGHFDWEVLRIVVSTNLFEAGHFVILMHDFFFLILAICIFWNANEIIQC